MRLDLSKVSKVSKLPPGAWTLKDPFKTIIVQGVQGVQAIPSVVVFQFVNHGHLYMATRENTRTAWTAWTIAVCKRLFGVQASLDSLGTLGHIGGLPCSR